MSRVLHSFTLFVCLTLLVLGTSAQAVTLEDVYNREALICGVTTGDPGFSAPDSTNNWHGIEIDLCKAISSVVFGSTEDSYYEIVPLTSSERVSAVATGEVDILVAKVAWSWLQSIDYNVGMIGPYFRDGQGVMVRNTKKVRNIWNMQNTSVCVIEGSSDERHIKRFLKRIKYYVDLSLFAGYNDMLLKFEEGACDAITADITVLAHLRNKLRNPLSVTILPQLLTQKPIGIVVSYNDIEWPQIIQLIFSGLVQAEELGLTSRNIALADENGSPEQQDFIAFGKDDRFDVFSSDNWIVEMISAYGNYGEMFERNFGKQTKTYFPRGLNRLWFTGGLVAQTPLYYELPNEDKQ